MADSLSPIQRSVLDRLAEGETILCQPSSVLDRQVGELVTSGMLELYQDNGQQYVRFSAAYLAERSGTTTDF